MTQVPDRSRFSVNFAVSLFRSNSAVLLRITGFWNFRESEKTSITDERRATALTSGDVEGWLEC